MNTDNNPEAVLSRIADNLEDIAQMLDESCEDNIDTDKTRARIKEMTNTVDFIRNPDRETETK